MYVYFNNNPAGRVVGDCAIRALSKALNITWEGAYIKAISAGFKMGDMPSSDSVWGAVLRANGFYRESIPDTCPDCYTAGDFAEEHQKGTYVLGFGGHVATIIDGDIYDSWDSSEEIPQYVWFKREENINGIQ